MNPLSLHLGGLNLQNPPFYFLNYIVFDSWDLETSKFHVLMACSLSDPKRSIQSYCNV